MKTIAIGVLGLVLVRGSVFAQTPEEQSRILHDFQQSVTGYTERYRFDWVAAPEGAPAADARIFTLPVAMVFRQLIAGAIAGVPATAAMRGTNLAHDALPGGHVPATELVDFPLVLKAALPPLPDGLEYRLVGNDLVIRDPGTGWSIALLRDAIGAVATVKR